MQPFKKFPTQGWLGGCDQAEDASLILYLKDFIANSCEAFFFYLLLMKDL